MSKHEKASEAIELIQAAVQVRHEINEHNQQYKGLCSIAVTATGVSLADMKKAIDAVYYFGGGFPSENSKGRMEMLLDGFAGMYRVLEFAGRGSMVENHLKQYGITVNLEEDYRIKNQELTENELTFLSREYSSEYFNLTEISDTRELMNAIIEECTVIQSLICEKADHIRDGLRPTAQAVLGIEDEEYDRLEGFVKLAAKSDDKSHEKVVDKKAKINSSLQSFQFGLTAIPK